MTPERIEQERAKFEKNIPKSGITSYKQRLKSGEYAYDHIKFAWEMWQARAAQSEWISVEERLPEEKRHYLTCHAGGVARVCQFDGKKFSYWEYDEEEWEFVEVICIPDYWQPLPEPPETRGK
ncbi:DUF551 domain-containing protein [Kingella denitrificans]